MHSSIGLKGKSQAILKVKSNQQHQRKMNIMVSVYECDGLNEGGGECEDWEDVGVGRE